MTIRRRERVSLFTNAGLELQTFLVPTLPGPFPFTGTWVLTDLDNAADSLTGSLVGLGQATGPPSPPLGFPPFAVNALFTATGGTGAFGDAAGVSSMSGTALFTFLSPDQAFSSGEGMLSVTVVPEPGTMLGIVGTLPVFVGIALRRRKMKR